MTKADLIEEVSRAVEMTEKDSQEVIEGIFDSVVRARRGGDKIEPRVLEASALASGSRAWGAIPKQARAWKFRPSACLISSPARN